MGHILSLFISYKRAHRAPLALLRIAHARINITASLCCSVAAQAHAAININAFLLRNHHLVATSMHGASNGRAAYIFMGIIQRQRIN